MQEDLVVTLSCLNNCWQLPNPKCSKKLSTLYTQHDMIMLAGKCKFTLKNNFYLNFCDCSTVYKIFNYCLLMAHGMCAVLSTELKNVSK
jgi:hypothetical protein